ncbi:MAG: YlmH/Sll1252 family protein [Bacteroidales bacterium]|nr:YlmH/Sll1252 family protein [Lachnoclostridium sp.]MCM1384818.1 YlmH/Sll1252 family protein [Lachnoclostridium sp.]MCM1466419.1 YlmH/Sll1252 family protein [Bacteroidales bacterium]
MAPENEKERQQFKNRLKELADKSYAQGIFTFTGFLGLSEQELFWQTEPELKFAGYTLFGGSKSAERKVVRFGDSGEWGYETAFPVACIHIKPKLPKFADVLSHRDFLGALMNLGIERSTVGDIIVGDKEGYFFCLETVAEFICQNLKQIRHTNVECKIVNPGDEISLINADEPEKITVQVASLRLDAVLAKVYRKSRSECQEWICGGKVYVDGRLCENPSRSLKDGETVNARGYGKFVFLGEAGTTRKGKLSVEAAVYH